MGCTKLFVVCYFAAISVVMSATARRPANRPVTVCEVLTKVDVYRGKIITLRAILRGGRHGEFLQDANGDEPCEGVSKHGHAWPPAVAITQYTRGSDVEDGPATFESDTEEIRTALAEARDQVRGHSGLAIVATFTGQLRARKDIQIVRDSDRGYYGTGYGQGGQYPALLVLKAVRDVNVVKKGPTRWPSSTAPR